MSRTSVIGNTRSERPFRAQSGYRSFPITLREMEAVHLNCLFSAPDYPAPMFPVHLLTGDATLAFLKASAELMAGLPYIRITVLPGGTHSSPALEPERVYDAFRRAFHVSAG